MSLIVELSILAIVFLSTYAAYEVRLMRQIAEATRLHDQILGALPSTFLFTTCSDIPPVMARGRLWAKYPGARFDIITSTTFSRNKLIASLIMYTGKRNGGWVLLVKTRRGHHDIPQALEDLYEELAICIIKNEGMCSLQNQREGIS
jgi:hypothetical protein